MSFLEFLGEFLTMPLMVACYVLLIVAGILCHIAEKELEEQKKKRKKKTKAKIYYLEDYKDRKAQ